MTPLSRETIDCALRSMGALVLPKEECENSIWFIYNGTKYCVFMNRHMLVSIMRQVSFESFIPPALEEAITRTDMDASVCRVQKGIGYGEVDIILYSLGSSLEHFIATFEKSLLVIQLTLGQLQEAYKEMSGIPIIATI